MRERRAGVWWDPERKLAADFDVVILFILGLFDFIWGPLDDVVAADLGVFVLSSDWQSCDVGDGQSGENDGAHGELHGGFVVCEDVGASSRIALWNVG